MLNLISGLVSGVCLVVLWAVFTEKQRLLDSVSLKCSEHGPKCPYLSEKLGDGKITISDEETIGWVHDYQTGHGYFVTREGKRV